MFFKKFIYVSNYTTKDFETGFLFSYMKLGKDYFNIKTNINNLKQYDTISSICIILEGIDELVCKYQLTEYYTKYNPFGITYEKKLPLIITFDSNDLINSPSLNEMTKKKFYYDIAQCPQCGYSKDGVSLNENNLHYIVSNLYLPNILFISIEDINYKEL